MTLSANAMDMAGSDGYGAEVGLDGLDRQRGEEEP